MFVIRSFCGRAHLAPARRAALPLVLAGIAGAALLVGCRGAGDASRASDAPASSADSSGTTAPPSAGAVRGADDAPIDADAATIVVSGLACPKCASNVDQELTRVPGVTVRNVDMKHGLVSVSFEGATRPTSARLARAVTDAGLTWRGWTPANATDARP